MPLQGLCIELRPNLRSGLVLLLFDRVPRHRRLVIREHSVYIAEGSVSETEKQEQQQEQDEDEDQKQEDVLVLQHDWLGLDFACISAFTASGRHISFRFNYTKINLEALDAVCASPASPPPLLLACCPDQCLAIACAGCGARLLPELRARRLREFPACIVDPAEFFCHGHGHGCASLGQAPSLVPAAGDLFYGPNFVVTSLADLGPRPGLLVQEEHLYCGRCMRFVGLGMFNGAAGRLWADAVKWLPVEEQLGGTPTTPTPRHFFQGSSSLTVLVKRLLHSLWPQPLPQLCLSSSRAALVASLADRSHRYLLVHVVESQLRVLRRVRVRGATQLRCFRACKLYFGVFGPQQPALLLQWQSEQALPQTDLSPDMLQALAERLEANMRLIPPAWRSHSTEPRLQLSYFFYDDDDDDDEAQEAGTPSGAEPAVTKPEQGEYETDAGHASEGESDDEHSDTDSAPEAGAGSSKRCPPTPPRGHGRSRLSKWPSSTSSSSSGSSEGM